MHPKAVPLTVGETTYTLFYDLNALCVLRESGVDAFSLTQEQLSDPRTIRVMLWGATRKYHPALSLEQVGELALSDLGEAAIAMTEALRKATTREIVGPDPQ